LLLVIAGAVGFGLGLGLELLISGSTSANGVVGPAAGAFAVLFGFTGFFWGVYGYRGITRGLVWQVVGMLLGALFVTGIRALLGAESQDLFGAYIFSEPAWVFGGLVGVISFLFGVGVVYDWMQWARGIDTHEHHEDEPGWEKYFGVSLDHKVIGIQYTVTALVLIAIGGTFALIFRSELAASQLQFLTTTLGL
jgi:hypothetical protein